MTHRHRWVAYVRYLPVRFFTQTHLLSINTTHHHTKATHHHTKGTTVKPTEHTSKTPRSATGLFVLLRVLLCVKGTDASKTTQVTDVCSPIPVLTTLTTIAATLLASAGLTAALPASASAYATPEAPPTYSSAPGLPDGRVYEQVSPVDKNGNEAGATASAIAFARAKAHTGYAAPDGGSVLFEGTGAMGESASPDGFTYVAQHSSVGWSTHSASPALHTTGPYPEALGGEVGVAPSPDLSHAMLGALQYTLAPLPNGACYYQLYLAGSDPFVAATWLLRPQIANPVGECGEVGGDPIGGTPSFSTVYFGFAGTLLPEDASRAPHASEVEGLYEDREGVLREAGVLPDGGFDPFGAVAAAPRAAGSEAYGGNAVSTEPSLGSAPAGSRVFFVSPDPVSCGKGNNCVLDPPQLYVRENGEQTLLVSRDALLPAAAGGLPVGAPDGVSLMSNAEFGASGSYVFASPDGSQAFFQSADALTGPAEEAGSGSGPKTYDFDLETGVLTYLPGVVGKVAIVAADSDGSSFAFVRPAAGGAPAELDVWAAGPDGGGVTAVTRLPGGTASVVRMSSDGSVIAFQATGVLSSAFNSGGALQVYRYDVPANTLGCVSCGPPGVQSVNASLSSTGIAEWGSAGEKEGEVEGSYGSGRGISADGDRVFFDTATPLVPQDSNTNAPEVRVFDDKRGVQGVDVYEWENGVVYLISGGWSPRNSYLLDSSENGDDVFFATTEGLVPGDTDGSYDVYDARVPQETPTSAAVPCEGSVCQGPPDVPSPLTPPASATFSGLGNLTPEVTPPPPPAKTTAKTVRCKKGYVKKKSKCVKDKKRTKATKAGNDLVNTNARGRK